jgi:hypothetical protein
VTAFSVDTKSRHFLFFTVTSHFLPLSDFSCLIRSVQVMNEYPLGEDASLELFSVLQPLTIDHAKRQEALAVPDAAVRELADRAQQFGIRPDKSL